MNMKQIPRQVGCFLGAVVLAAMIGCASTAKQESTSEYVDDTVITTRVKTAILGEPALKVLQINVETYKGVVQLSGFIDSRTRLPTSGVLSLVAIPLFGHLELPSRRQPSPQRIVCTRD